MAKLVKIVTMSFFLLIFLASTHTISASVNYPLQDQYPDIMFYKADTDKKVIALTFDDGPDLRFTPYILDVLDMYDVKATFFLLGMRVESYPNVAKRIHEEGHQIGNHTYWHSELVKTKNLFEEMKKNEKTLKTVLDVETDLFRAPYGALSEKQVEKLGDNGYKGIGWSVDSEDWKSLKAEEIKQNVLDRVHPGAIILMHSAGNWTQDLSGTAEALKDIIPELREQGYEFVTVEELSAYKNKKGDR